jgi:Holliday junction DNA helicase RuvA
MISRLNGVIVECKPDHVVLDVCGVGYLLQIPLSTYYELPPVGGPPVVLQVHTHVREDALQLFGFSTHSERQMFVKLIGISGIGPRVALGFLSGIGAEELRECVNLQDRARLQKIPGVGKKTAERVLLELRDRLGEASGEDRDENDRDATRPRLQSGGPIAIREDALSALVNLGYSREAAARAVERVEDGADEKMTLERLLRRALVALAG